MINQYMVQALKEQIVSKLNATESAFCLSELLPPEGQNKDVPFRAV